MKKDEKKSDVLTKKDLNEIVIKAIKSTVPSIVKDVVKEIVDISIEEAFIDQNQILNRSFAHVHKEIRQTRDELRDEFNRKFDFMNNRMDEKLLIKADKIDVVKLETRVIKLEKKK